MSEMTRDDIELSGRRRIYTDEREITSKNVISVLQKSLIDHAENASAIRYLVKYERGCQPLKREKKIRADIDIQVCDNIAAEIVDFKLGYNWGNPITYIQRGDTDLSDADPKTDDLGISLLNEMLECEHSSVSDQEMLYYLEVTGVGYQFVDIKREEDDSAFDFASLNPLYTFVVYDNSIMHRPILGVTYRTFEDGNSIYTCFTKERRYDVLNKQTIVNGVKEDEWTFSDRSGERNPLGMIPIIEFNRMHDRTGVFERQITDMDALNILVSDFSNNVSQDVQALWWGVDFELPEDEKGNVEKPDSGQWLITHTTENKDPKLQPLVIPTDYTGILANIQYRRDIIKQKCSIPTTGGSSGHATGTAMSMSTGWQNAEVIAAKETMFVNKGKVEIAKLILKAIEISPYVADDSPLKKLHINDIKPSIIRNKTYDLATKANTFATYVQHGIHPRHALSVIEAFPDVNLVYNDSLPYLEKFMNKLNATDDGNSSSDTETKRIQGDSSDQEQESSVIGSGSVKVGGAYGKDN